MQNPFKIKKKKEKETPQQIPLHVQKAQFEQIKDDLTEKDVEKVLEELETPEQEIRKKCAKEGN